MTTPLSKLLLILPITLAPLPALAQTLVERRGYGHGDWAFGWAHMLFGGLMMVAAFGGLVFAIVLAVRWLGSGPSQDAPRGRGLEILQERFARGEIDKAEFEERKRILPS